MNFLNEIIDEAIENGMSKENAKKILFLMKKYFNNDIYPFLTYNDFQNILYQLIDMNYQVNEFNTPINSIIKEYDRDKYNEINQNIIR